MGGYFRYSRVSKSPKHKKRNKRMTGVDEDFLGGCDKASVVVRVVQQSGAEINVDGYDGTD